MDGLGPTNRIVLQTNLASVESPDQIGFTIGHELKHYVMGDNWKALAIIAAFLLAGFWLTDRLGRAAIRRFSRLWGFFELSDPASLPLIVFGRSRPAADAAREVVERWLLVDLM